MATITIRITAVSGSTLTLQGGNTANVRRGDTVQWVVQGNVKITLTGITVDSGSHNIFDLSDTPPVPPNHGNRPMQGVVAANATGDENYTIHWQSDANGQYYSMDPTLRVNT